MTTEIPISEFFTAGGTLPPDAPSYVKRPTDDELFRHVMAGEFCYVLTPRQMGKSSLMIRTAQRLSHEGVKSAIVDLTQIGTVESEDQWYKGILTQIRRRLRLTTDPVRWWERKEDIPNIQKFIGFFEEALDEVKEHIVIFIDEIDTTLKLDFRDNFFAGVRAIYNARAQNPDLQRITFVLLGVASPSDLIKDRNRTPFNIGQEIPLKPFSREDAHLLEKGLEEVYPKSARKILDRVFYWTNGHPYLTQKMCQSVVENHLNESDDEEIDELVERLFISEEAGRETNLQFVRDNILSYAERRVILSLYKKLLRGTKVPDNKNSVPQNHLRLSGLASIKDGLLIVSNRIYKKVFDLRWVNKYTEVNWSLISSGVLGLIVIALFSILYNDGVRLPNQADRNITCVDDYKDYTGIACLADLFEQAPIFLRKGEYPDRAKDKFFNTLSWDNQKSLIEIGYSEHPPEPQDLVTVINGLYTSLADVDNSSETTRLLEIMRASLEIEKGDGKKKNLSSGEKDLYQKMNNLDDEIVHWINARREARNGNLKLAVDEYTAAILLNSVNPATLFERARIYTQRREYEKAANDYEAVITIALQSKSRPVPTSSPTSTEIPTETPTRKPKLTSTSRPTLTPTLRPTLILTQTRIVSTTLTPSIQLSATAILIPTAITGATLTASPIPVTTAFTPTATPKPVQSRFSNPDQQFAAVRNEINQRTDLLLFLLENQINYPNLVSNGMVPTFTPAPTNTQAPVGSIVPSETTVALNEAPLSVTATSTLASDITPSPVPQSRILFQEDFEDNHIDWGPPFGDWVIEQEPSGNHYWSASGPNDYPQNFYLDESTLNWTDYAFESRIQFVKGNVLWICIRADAGDHWYGVVLDNNYPIINYFQGNPANVEGKLTSFHTSPREPFEYNKWYTIRIEVKGSNLKTYVDNVLDANLTLPSPLIKTQGGIGYFMDGGSEFYIDDIRVWSLNEVPTPPLESEVSRFAWVRYGPGLVFQAIIYVSPGDHLRVIGRSKDGNWLVVELENGATGWIEKDKLISQPEYEFLKAFEDPPTPTPGPTLPSVKPTRPSYPIGDFNHDCIVDDADYALFQSAFGTSDPKYDLNGDGTVDILDYQIFSNHYGDTCNTP